MTRYMRITPMQSIVVLTLALAAALAVPALAVAQPCPSFKTPEEAVAALRTASRAKDVGPLVTLLGAGGKDLAASSDAATGRRHRNVFLVAMREGWKLADVT